MAAFEPGIVLDAQGNCVVSPRLWPILVALILIGSVTLAGYIVALWPEEPGEAADQRRERPAPSALQSFEGGYFEPAPSKHPYLRRM